MLLFPLIVPSSDYFAIVNDDSTHRHLANGSAFVSLIQRYTHVVGISERVIEKMFYQDQWTIAQTSRQENSAAYKS
jgi:predicted xylose isomerase-like sugar epimerase